MYVEIKDNHLIKIGRNAKENDDLVKNNSKTCLWLHLGDQMTSPHGIIENLNGNKINKNIIYYTGCLIKKFSKYKNLKLVPLNYLELQYIKPSISDLGMVYLMKNPKSIFC
jgi:predicted ribosome quality control (RQC) complex YloA/Tae2 family protein